MKRVILKINTDLLPGCSVAFDQWCSLLENGMSREALNFSLFSNSWKQCPS